MKHKLIFRITYCSIMAAISGVLTYFEIPLGVFEITLSPIPLIFVGMIYGPIYGLLTALIAGIIEQITWGITLQTIWWLLAHFAWGGLSAVLYSLFKKILKDNKNYKKIIIYSLSIIICAVVANLCNSLALVIYGYTSEPINDIKMFIAYAIPRLVSIPIHIIIFIPICYIVCEKFKKIKIINNGI